MEKYNRNGVNALQLDPALNRLFTAGRDSIIRIWSVNQHKVRQGLSLHLQPVLHEFWSNTVLFRVSDVLSLSVELFGTLYKDIATKPGEPLKTSGVLEVPWLGQGLYKLGL